jgi:hypothetical protein
MWEVDVHRKELKYPLYSTVHKSTALVEYSTVYNNQNLFQPRWIWGISIPRMSPQQILHTVCACGLSLSLFPVLRFLNKKP